MISEGDFHGPRPLGREFQEFFTAPGLGDDLGEALQRVPRSLV